MSRCCQFVDGMVVTGNVGWDNNGGSCGFRYHTDWGTVKGCHAVASITAIFVVNDSGWLHDPESVAFSDLEVNGIGASPDKEACKDGGWVALGFENQGQCVSHFQRR